MAGKQGVSRLLARHRASLVRDLDTNKILPHLVAKEVISTSEERQVLDVSDPRKRTEVLLDILGKRGLGAFHDFCSCLEKVSPHLLTGFLLDNPGSLSPDGEKKPTQALQLSLELALNERDLMLRENAKAVEERDQAIRQLEQLRSEHNSALTSLENITGKPSKNTNSKSTELSPAAHRKSQRLLEKFRDMEQETDHEDGLDNVTWETHNVTLKRVPGFGFGIAVSGGRDNPHFANGDPSIAISDVLTAGPAEGRLLINDRVMSVNGIPLDNVDHKQAIAVLKDSGNKVNLVIRRRVLVPTYTEMDNSPLKITLARKNRRDDIGVVLGCKFYIKEITGNSIAAQDGGLKEGDVVLKINSTPIENLSLVDAKKMIEKTKDKLQLFISKSRYEDRLPSTNKAQEDEYSLGYGTLQGTLQTKRSDIDNVNIYRPSLSSPEEEAYKGHHNYQEIPPGAYPGTEHARYDGRYVYDHEAPPRPPLPDETDAPPRPPSPGKELLRPDDFYSPRSPRTPHSPTAEGYMSDHGRMDPHMQRRHHDERYVGKRKDIVLDPRFVYFEKEPEFGLGLRLAGGNATGIFIASVQPGSGAEAVGLTEGDQILKANDVEIPGMTREDAVTYLTSLEGRVSMVVQYKREEYDRIISSHEAGDSFYIRTHFEYQAKDVGELSFTIGDIFHIKDTLFRGVVGYWLAMRIGRNNQETQKGFIPNKNSAEMLFSASTNTESEKENSPTKSRSLIFKRKAARRSKSLGKDHWEDVIFSNLTTKFPAYERVTLRDPGFVRPVVIFGALADVAREKLLKEFPDQFESPQADANSPGGNDQRKSGIIRLGAIKEIINKRKHCLLDVTPHNVDKLNYAQYYPIVVFLKAENKTIVKECRAKFAKGSTKNHKKLFEQSQKLEKLYPHLFTATISHNSTEIWYQRMIEMVQLQQTQPIWMSEHKPEDNVNDDFLFPMGSRASYSPQQENEPSTPTKAPRDDFDASPKHKKRLIRSSSDPSINTTDRVPGIPPYPAPPSYHRSPASPHGGLMDDRRYVDFDRQSEDRYYPSYYASESLPPGQFPHSRSIDPYATITPHERLRSKIPEDGQWYNPAYDDRGPQRFNPDYHRSEPDLGRHINHNRPSTASLPPPQPHQPHSPASGPPPHPQHTQVMSPPPTHSPASGPPPHPQHSQPFQENASSYSSDSYSRYTSNPVNRHDDSKLREKFGSMAVAGKGERSNSHNPYRFTRSTANPVNTANVDKSKLSDLSARYRKDEQQPSRKQSLPSPTISPPVNQPQVSSVPSHHAPLQDGAPLRVKKEPPPVPVKTYHLRDRGIEPDDLKIRNYENSNRAYNYSDPSSYPAPDQKHQYNDQNENPYDYVAPRQHMNRSRTSPNQNAVYARPYTMSEKHAREGSYDRGRSFMNQIYMDTEQLQKLRARQDNGPPPMSSHGNRDLAAARDSGYPSPDRPSGADDINGHSNQGEGISDPRTSFSSYKNLITPGFYGAKKPTYFMPDDLGDQNKVTSHDASDRERSSHEDSDDRSSAFEAYRKPVMSTFGKVSPGKGFEPSKHIRTSSPKPDIVLNKNSVDNDITNDVTAPEDVKYDTPPENLETRDSGENQNTNSSSEDTGTIKRRVKRRELNGTDTVSAKQETDDKKDDLGDDSDNDQQELSPTESTGFSTHEEPAVASALNNGSASPYDVNVDPAISYSSKYSLRIAHHLEENNKGVKSFQNDGQGKSGTKIPTSLKTDKYDDQHRHSQDSDDEGKRKVANSQRYAFIRRSGLAGERRHYDNYEGHSSEEMADPPVDPPKSQKYASIHKSGFSGERRPLDNHISHSSLDRDTPVDKADSQKYANIQKAGFSGEKKVQDENDIHHVHMHGAKETDPLVDESGKQEVTRGKVPPASVFSFPKMRLDRYKLGNDSKTPATGSRTDRYRGLLGTHGRMSSYEKSFDVVDGEQNGHQNQDSNAGDTGDTKEPYGKIKVEKVSENESPKDHSMKDVPEDLHDTVNAKQSEKDDDSGELNESPSSNTLVENEDDSSTDTASEDGSLVKSPSNNTLVEMDVENKDQVEDDYNGSDDEVDSVKGQSNGEVKENNIHGLSDDPVMGDGMENGIGKKYKTSESSKLQEERNFSGKDSKGPPETKAQKVETKSGNDFSFKRKTEQKVNDEKAALNVKEDNKADKEVMEILDYDRMYDRPTIGHSLTRGISHESPTREVKGQEVRRSQGSMKGRKVQKNQEFRTSHEIKHVKKWPDHTEINRQSVEQVVRNERPVGNESDKGKHTIYRTYRRTSKVTKRDVLAYNKDIKETCVDDIYDDEVDDKAKKAASRIPDFTKDDERNGSDRRNGNLKNGDADDSEEDAFTISLKKLHLENLNIGATLSSDTNITTSPIDSTSAKTTEEGAQRSEETDPVTGDSGAKGERSNAEQVSASNTFLVGPDTGQLIEGNHTVVATARGVFDHQGGVLESPETGVSIVIPKAAIPEGVTQEIYFKVCKDNNILPPLDKDKGETLLSPLVMCGPHGLKFLQPVELRLPHCASVNPDSWSFALKSSDSPTGHPTQWQNMTLAGMDGVAQGRVGRNSVSVLVDHF